MKFFVEIYAIRAFGLIGVVLCWKKVDFFEKVFVGIDELINLLNFGHLIVVDCIMIFGRDFFTLFKGSVFRDRKKLNELDRISTNELISVIGFWVYS